MSDRRQLEFNGTIFENIINRELASRYSDAIVLPNVTLWSDFLEKNTQIDLLLIHPRGVFVIEAKSWRYYVIGEYGDTHWQGKSSNLKVMSTFNPVNQNMIHIRALRNAIRTKCGVEPINFVNIVCFPDGTKIKSKCSEVCNLSLLTEKIDEIILGRPIVIDTAKYLSLITSVCKVETDA